MKSSRRLSLKNDPPSRTPQRRNRTSWKFLAGASVSQNCSPCSQRIEPTFKLQTCLILEMGAGTLLAGGEAGWESNWQSSGVSCTV